MVQVNAKIEINLMLEPSIVKIQHIEEKLGIGKKSARVLKTSPRKKSEKILGKH
jgi:hypothetical protein